MTYEEWVDTYKPIKNSIDDNASYDGTMFETYGDELAQVRKAWEANPNTVWTLLEEDDYLWIGAGYHYVNRLGYFITEQYFLDEFLEIPLGGPDDFADDDSFQARVGEWMKACFTSEIIADKLERADRFIEEALELVQATGYSAKRAHALVDYVFGRPIGDPEQEVGGVMVTLAALCNPHEINVEDAAEVELRRIWTKVEQIRAKQASKPTGSALPIPCDGHVASKDDPKVCGNCNTHVDEELPDPLEAAGAYADGA